MEKEISPGLKITFLIHFIGGGLFGLTLLFFPRILGIMSGQPVLEPIAFRLFGTSVLALSFSSWLAYKEKLWEKVKILVQMEIVWSVLFVITAVYGVVMGQLPVMEIMDIFIIGAFGVAFAIFYSRMRAG